MTKVLTRPLCTQAKVAPCLGLMTSWGMWITVVLSRLCLTFTGHTNTRSTVNTDCNVQINGNAGCGVRFPTAQSYGTSFNSIGGGWYAMERSNACIRVWFWPRNGAVPSDVRSGASSVETENWVRASARVIYESS